ncbi:MAG: iron chelate uptake ABC transporter family permease subunit [Halothiobacillaceae bacterium]|nr:iron chelate uptake ABC transporter family permease subunit [Halothiobacillaceae bacterium]
MSAWDALFAFWRLDDPNVLWVTLGMALLGASSGLIGTFAVLEKRALLGDVLAHAALPGVTMAFFLFHTREPLVILLGAAAAGLLAWGLIDLLTRRARLRQDSALAIVLSLFFALGILQLTWLQRQPLANQAGLDKFLFGQAASLTDADLYLLGTVALGLILLTALLFDRLRLILFDRQHALALGVPVRRYELLLAAMLVCAVVIGLQLAGVVLMAALLLTPAATARLLSDRLRPMLFIAMTLGVLAGVTGANVSYLAPRMPTGPWMVVALSLFFIAALLLAPQRGLLPRALRQRSLRRRVEEENILRTLFKLHEETSVDTLWSQDDIRHHRPLGAARLNRILQRLHREGMLDGTPERMRLSAAGLKRATTLTRGHRLWETYLENRLGLSPERAHFAAEAAEHVLDEATCATIERELGRPSTDPHGRPIPERPDAAEAPSR